MLDLEVFRVDVFDVLVGHCIAQGLQLLRRAPIVLQHDQQGLSTCVRSLAVATGTCVPASGAWVFAAITLVSLSEEPVIYLLHYTGKTNEKC